MVEFPELNLHFRKVYQYYLTVYDARVYLLRQKNAEKQYKVFLKRYPKLANRVHIKYIAQYLNIHPVTLSKIRNKLKNSKL